MTFREHGRPNPSKDKDLQSCFLLQQQYISYIKDNPKQKQQKAITICIIAKIAKQQNTELQRAIGQLTTVASYFVMQSCEYLKVTQAKKRQTDIVHLCNLCFFKDGILIKHNNLHLEFSDCILITFEMQTKEEKNDTVMQISLGDVNMCPFRIGTAIVCRIRSYEGTNNDTPISAFSQFNRINHVTSKQSSHRQRCTTYQERRNWHSLNQIGCDNGHVPRQLLSLPHHDDRLLVQRCIFTIHSKTGRTTQPQRFQKNNQRHVPPAHPNVHNSFSFPPRPEAKEQPQQCRDKKECRWRHDLTSQASPLCAL